MRIAEGLFAAVMGLAATAAMPAPAVAQESRTGEIVERLNDPVTQLMASALIVSMTESLLDLNIEPIVKAVECVGGKGARELPPEATVRDLAGSGAERLPREIARTVPKMMAAMGDMAAAMDGMRPELEAMAERMKDAVPGY